MPDVDKQTVQAAPSLTAAAVVTKRQSPVKCGGAAAGKALPALNFYPLLPVVWNHRSEFASFSLML